MKKLTDFGILNCCCTWIIYINYKICNKPVKIIKFQVTYKILNLIYKNNINNRY